MFKEVFFVLFIILINIKNSLGMQVDVYTPARLRNKIGQTVSIPFPADANRLFIIDHNNSASKPDKKHTLGVASLVLTMYRIDLPINFNNWNNNTAMPLSPGIPNSGRNAFYSPSHKSITFYNDAHKDFDVVAHETGHAILDHICPKYNQISQEYTKALIQAQAIPNANQASINQNIDTAIGINKRIIGFQLSALHEAFGDITAIFASLHIAIDEMDQGMVYNLFANPYNVPCIAPYFAGNATGLRNFAIGGDYNQCFMQNDFHKYSQIVTKFITKCCEQIFYAELQYGQQAAAGPALQNIPSNLRKPVLESLLYLNQSLRDHNQPLNILESFCRELQEKLLASYPDLSVCFLTHFNEFNGNYESLKAVINNANRISSTRRTQLPQTGGGNTVRLRVPSHNSNDQESRCCQS